MDVIYLLGGLGVDKLVFKQFKTIYPTEIIIWEEPLVADTLSTYAQRISAQINTDLKFGLLGVSFGGIVALELTKFIKPECVILISSVLSPDQLPINYLTRISSRLLNVVPDFILNKPNSLIRFMFNPADKQLFDHIIRETSPTFLKWALSEIMKWKGVQYSGTVHRIHGTRDRVIPLKGNAHIVDRGGHFMIVDLKDELGQIIDNII